LLAVPRSGIPVAPLFRHWECFPAGFAFCRDFSTPSMTPHQYSPFRLAVHDPLFPVVRLAFAFTRTVFSQFFAARRPQSPAPFSHQTLFFPPRRRGPPVPLCRSELLPRRPPGCGLFIRRFISALTCHFLARKFAAAEGPFHPLTVGRILSCKVSATSPPGCPFQATLDPFFFMILATRIC